MSGITWFLASGLGSHANEEVARYWLKHVIAAIEDRGDRAHVVPCDGVTLSDHGQSFLANLPGQLPEGPIGFLGYSFGGAIVQMALAMGSDELRRRVEYLFVLNGPGPRKMTLKGYWGGFTSIPVPYLLGFFGGIEVKHEDDWRRLLFQGEIGEDVRTRDVIAELQRNAHPTSLVPCIELLPIGRMRPLPSGTRAVRVVGADDHMFGPKVDERPQIPEMERVVLHGPGSYHGLVFSLSMSGRAVTMGYDALGLASRARGGGLREAR